MKSPMVLSVSLCLSLAACGSDPPAATDAAVTDLGATQDTAADVAADVTARDVAADVTNDVPARDVNSTDAVATDAVTDTGVDAPADRVAVSDVPSDNAADVTPGRGCGGRGGSPCPSGQFCDFPISSICGAADGPGVCTAPPNACTDLFDPVCGCDGRTYSNSCDAAAQSVSVSARGACRSATDAGADVTPTDCRTTGCSGSSTCMPCRGVGGLVYACIPSGAAC